MKIFKKDQKLFLILERGEKLVESITQCAQAHDIRSASISGLGALMDVELGFYHLSSKSYDRKTFTSEYELLALNGNIALKEGKPFVHVHAVLGDEDFSAFGGHLFEAVVAVTVEIALLPVDLSLHREPNESVGLALICREG